MTFWKSRSAHFPPNSVQFQQIPRPLPVNSPPISVIAGGNSAHAWRRGVIPTIPAPTPSIPNPFRSFSVNSRPRSSDSLISGPRPFRQFLANSPLTFHQFPTNCRHRRCLPYTRPRTSGRVSPTHPRKDSDGSDRAASPRAAPHFTSVTTFRWSDKRCGPGEFLGPQSRFVSQSQFPLAAQFW
jgi:hypothetical protein